ncbi:hypothetical protein [Pseudonocardia acaciae]|uniref:hypothetical protein n=1 Tax=Pseudonocardia acaciae TaxID=551276 RepID=UPI0012ECDE5C|nr:hypothetical protein [Pseudonocardia acaciae]
MAALLLAGCLALMGCSTGSPASPGPNNYGDTATARSRIAPGNARFDLPEFGFTFDYPEQMNQHLHPSPGDQFFVNLTAEGRSIGVTRQPLRNPVTVANIDQAKSDLDRIMSFFPGSPQAGTRVEVAGWPGVEYNYDYDASVDSFTHNRRVVFYAESTRYDIICKSGDEHRRELDSACQTALTTVRPR